MILARSRCEVKRKGRAIKYGVIYTLIDGTNDKEYVGQTVRPVEMRFKQYARTDSAIKECESKEELDYWEKHFIKSRDTMLPNGYNLKDGGNGGGIPCAETRAKLSMSKIGENHSFFGKHHTAETKSKISATNKGNI
ncbi:MAG: hypothetical protein IKI76_11155 [Selenomonadaceae bacterium]|nr:hypothetical protein [Selenomonadaceae bacterium]